MTEELYINGQLADLPNDSVIALSFAVNTLFDVKTLQGNISNNINLPKTKNNLRILGFPDNMNIDLSKTIRKKAVCRFVQDGVEILRKGIVQYGTVTNKGIAIIITSGNIDFFDLVDGSIQKLNLSAYDHNFNSADIPASRLNRVGYVYPVVNYGTLTNTSDHVNMRLMRPATFVKTVVDSIVKETGFTLVNDLETNSKTAFHYSNMILPFSLDTFQHGQRKIDALQFLELQAEGTMEYSHVWPNGAENTEVYSQFDTVIKDDSNSFSLNQKYTATQDFVADITISVRQLYFYKVYNGFGMDKEKNWIDFNIHVNSVVVGTTRVTLPNYGNDGPRLYDVTQDNVVVTASGFRIHTGDQIQLALHTINDFPGTGDASKVFLYPAVDFNIKPVISSINYGETVELEATLPDISKKDFLKAIANIYGGIIQTDNQNKTVHIIPFMSIKNNVDKSADWSDRIVNPDDEGIALTLGDYSQTNTGSYNNDDSINPPDYASANILIADENLPVIAKDLFTLPFSASMDSKVLSGMKAVLIKKAAALDATDFSISTNARICMIEFVDGPRLVYKDDETPLFSDIETTSIPMTYFASGITTLPDMLMQTFFNRYYKEITIVLNDQRKLTIPMLLKKDDIENLDFFKPVFLRKYATYFYISKINNYVGGKPCNVDLIKLY